MQKVLKVRADARDLKQICTPASDHDPDRGSETDLEKLPPALLKAVLSSKNSDFFDVCGAPHTRVWRVIFGPVFGSFFGVVFGSVFGLVFGPVFGPVSGFVL